MAIVRKTPLKVGELQRMVPSPSMSWMIQNKAAKDIALLSCEKAVGLRVNAPIL